jgi:hypothetical protein
LSGPDWALRNSGCDHWRDTSRDRRDGFPTQHRARASACSLRDQRSSNPISTMGAQEATYCQGRQEPSYRADDDFLAVPVTRRCRRCRDRVKRVKTAWLGNAVAMMLAGLEPLMSALGPISGNRVILKADIHQSGFARPLCATSGHSSQGMLAERSLVFTRHLLLPHILREKLPDSIHVSCRCQH